MSYLILSASFLWKIMKNPAFRIKLALDQKFSQWCLDWSIHAQILRNYKCMVFRLFTGSSRNSLEIPNTYAFLQEKQNE